MGVEAEDRLCILASWALQVLPVDRRSDSSSGMPAPNGEREEWRDETTMNHSALRELSKLDGDVSDDVVDRIIAVTRLQLTESCCRSGSDECVVVDEVSMPNRLAKT